MPLPGQVQYTDGSSVTFTPGSEHDLSATAPSGRIAIGGAVVGLDGANTGSNATIVRSNLLDQDQQTYHAFVYGGYPNSIELHARVYHVAE